MNSMPLFLVRISQAAAPWSGRNDLLVLCHQARSPKPTTRAESSPRNGRAASVRSCSRSTHACSDAGILVRAENNDPEGGGSVDLVQELRNHVAKEIGPIAKPRSIMIVPELPKTRSGKIMRRLLKDVAENREVGDVTTLADSSVMNLIQSGLQK